MSPDDGQFSLSGESFGKGVLDSGCTKAVSGDIWMDEYLSTLTNDDKRLVEERDSNAILRFGNGVETTAIRNVKVPVVIGSHCYMMSIDVVRKNIPLLISNRSMKTMGMQLDFRTDTAKEGQQRVPLTCTTTRHFCLPLTNFNLDETSNSKIVLHAVHLKDLTRDKKFVKAKKLHCQFVHASKEKLLKLVRNSKDFIDKEFERCIEQCCDQCEIRKKYKRPSPRPTVGLPLADNFSQVVCMDLKEYEHNKI